MSSIRDVAAAAGVSRMTVSNVINGRHHKASAETVARVLRAIEELDYVPDAPARSLAANRSRMIGLVIHHPDETRALLENPHDALLLGSVGRSVAAAGFSFIPAVSDDVVSAARRLGSWRIDGLIVYGSVADEVNDLQRTHPRPLVFLDNYSRDQNVPIMGTDDVDGGLQAGRHLIGLGHRVIAYVGPLRAGSCGVVAHRFGGLQRAVQERGTQAAGAQAGERRDGGRQDGGRHAGGDQATGAPVQLVPIEADHHPGSAARAVEQILSDPSRPTAIVASSDVLAAEILGELLDRGIAVPRDMSVVGFDDMPLARWVRPQLTTIGQDVKAKAAAAVDMVVRMIDQENVAGAHGALRVQRLPMRLVVRDSTGPAPGTSQPVTPSPVTS